MLTLARVHAQESSDTLSLLLSCEKKLSTMLEIIGKAAPNVSQAQDTDSSFFVTSSPVSICARVVHPCVCVCVSLTCVCVCV